MDIINFTKTNIPATTNVSLPDSNNKTDEYRKFSELLSSTTRTNSGQKTFTSSTSGITYDTANSAYQSNPDIYNKGETGLMNLLFYLYGQVDETVTINGTSVKKPGGWIVGADDINALVENDRRLNTGKANSANAYIVTLGTTGWDITTMTQTISVGLTNVSSGDSIIVAPATPAMISPFNTSGICATLVAAGSITFSCTSIPTSNINVMILDLGIPNTSAGTNIINVTSIFSLPSQTGNGGKFLQTDGSSVSWADSLPTNLSETSPTGTTRRNYEGYFYATRVYGSVYNDYAEYRECIQSVKPGYVVQEISDGTVIISFTKRSKLAHIVTDTFGMTIGIDDKKSMVPVALCGRTLAYVDGKYKVGDCVCSNGNGQLKRMNKLEQLLFPLSVVGVISEIPAYKTWNDIKVDGRVWITVVK